MFACTLAMVQFATDCHTISPSSIGSNQVTWWASWACPATNTIQYMHVSKNMLPMDAGWLWGLMDTGAPWSCLYNEACTMRPTKVWPRCQKLQVVYGKRHSKRRPKAMQRLYSGMISKIICTPILRYLPCHSLQKPTIPCHPWPFIQIEGRSITRCSLVLSKPHGNGSNGQCLTMLGAHSHIHWPFQWTHILHKMGYQRWVLALDGDRRGMCGIFVTSYYASMMETQDCDYYLSANGVVQIPTILLLCIRNGMWYCTETPQWKGQPPTTKVGIVLSTRCYISTTANTQCSYRAD